MLKNVTFLQNYISHYQFFNNSETLIIYVRKEII
jgi:hypothetical protein